MSAINSLHDCALPFGEDGPVETIVHAGPADARLLERYLALWPARVVWIDDDAERLNALRDAAGAVALHCVHACVDATAGERTWLSFEVTALDGPLPPAPAAREVFPRMAPPQGRRVVARALDDLVVAALAAGADGGRVMLCIDLPGRELALFASLRPRTVERLSGLLVRGCSQRLLEGGATLAETVARLVDHGWRSRGRSDLMPMWPAAVLMFDIQLEQITTRLAGVEAALAEADARAATLRGERDGARALHASAAAREAGLLARIASCEADGVGNAARAKRLAAELERVEPRLDEALAIERRLRDEQLVTAIQREALRVRVEQLAEQLDEASAARDACVRGKEAASASLSAAREQLRECGERLADTTAARDVAVRDKNALQQHRETQALALADAQKHVRELTEQLAHASSVRDIALRDKSALAQQRESQAATLAQVQAQARQLAEQLTQANAARDLALREKTALVHQREKHVAALAEAQRLASRQEGAAVEATARQRVLEDALARADGQLAVVRDLLLRD